MHDTASDAVREIGLLDSLRGNWIKLPTAAMREAGPAAQTLGGLLKLTNRATFRTTAAIASSAQLPLPTCRKHLATLEAQGWIVNIGRQRTERGAPRRTCTILVTDKTRKAVARGMGDGDLVYGVLPWWASANIRTLHRDRTGRRVAQSQQPSDQRRRRIVQIVQTGRMPWSAKAVLSIVMARLMSLMSVVEDQEGKADLNTDEPWGSISNLGDADRFRFPIYGRNGHGLAHLTGLNPESITTAKRWLHRHGIIELSSGRKAGSDGENVAAWLYPSESFRVVETPASQEGFIYVDLVA